MATRYPMYFDPTLPTARALAQTPPSYIIYKELGVCYARMKTGEIKFKGADDEVIQAAINALTEGGLVFLTRAEYEIGELVIRNDDITLMGEGEGTILKATSATPIIRSETDRVYYNIHIRNLELHGGGVATYGIQFYRDGVKDSVQDSSINTIYFDSIVNAAIRLNQAYKINIMDVNINGHTPVPGVLTDYGILIESSGGNLGIINNIITYCDECVRFDGGYDCSLIGNGLYYFRSRAIGSTAGGYSKARIIGNQIRGWYLGGPNAIEGMYLRAFKRSVIMGNTVGEVQRYGIRSEGDAYNAYIGNSFHSISNEADGGYSALYVTGVNLLIMGNYFYWDIANRPSHWIEEGAGSNENLIIGNYFQERAGVPPAPSKNIDIVGADTKAYHNYGAYAGYPTEVKGTATFPTGATSTTISHGLIGTPKIVVVTPHHSEIADIRVTAKASTTFTVEVSTAPTADRTFDYYAAVY